MLEDRSSMTKHGKENGNCEMHSHSAIPQYHDSEQRRSAATSDGRPRLGDVTAVMSTLRRRIVNALQDSPTPSPTPSRDGTPVPMEEVKLVSTKKLEKLTEKRPSKKRSGIIFGLGGLLGLLLALAFAQSQDIVRLEGLLEVNLDSLLDAIPAGIVNDVKDLSKSEREAVNYDSFSVGLHLQAQGIKAHHPVIMVPGVISTGLESWSTGEKSRQYFRKRLWGSWSMMKALVMDQATWKRHIMLDKETGLDPPDIKLRAAQGFDATDFFITGYWIWNKILENLATIGCKYLSISFRVHASVLALSYYQRHTLTVSHRRPNQRFYCCVRLALILCKSGGSRPVLHQTQELY